ncbi:GNAT family N-acetyltransferase [Candidatus Dependentiae bacterium]|nr:GNAT family N-acetyltransferase [Candidatus Dependentiae bacterium]
MNITKKIIIALSLILAVGAGIQAYSYYNGSIYTYTPQKDRAFILDLFKNNWYWLVSERSTDFSVEYMLDNKASSKLARKGDLTLKVYRREGAPVGFVSYFTKELYEGFVLFLAVNEKERSKGYARKLLAYALDDLKKRGCLVIRLITRTNNVRGQKLYTGMGFKKIWEHEGFVKFEKDLTVGNAAVVNA